MASLVLVATNACWASDSNPASASAAKLTPEQHVAKLKQSLKASKAQLLKYQWIETTIVSKDGKEKSRKQSNCYYDVNGALQKEPLADTEQAKEPRGPLRKRLAEKEKAEAKAYMQSASRLVHSYIPPDSARIQQAVSSGNLSVAITDPGKRVKLEFSNYMKPGDMLSVEVELPSNRLLGIGVSTYMDSPQDAVKLAVTMAVLPDGTVYAAKTDLNAAAKGLDVTIENSGYHLSSN